MVALAKQIGQCTDCDGTGSLVKGMFASVRGTVQALPNGNTPPILKVDAVSDKSVQELCSAPAPAPTPLTNADSTDVQVGDAICVEGFVMDHFCIQRGTLLDAPSIVTLEEPDQHSVHCLIDVPSCVNSPYEVRTKKMNPDAFHRGNDLIISSCNLFEHARSS